MALPSARLWPKDAMTLWKVRGAVGFDGGMEIVTDEIRRDKPLFITMVISKYRRDK